MREALVAARAYKQGSYQVTLMTEIATALGKLGLIKEADATFQEAIAAANASGSRGSSLAAVVTALTRN